MDQNDINIFLRNKFKDEIFLYTHLKKHQQELLPVLRFSSEKDVDYK